MLITHDSGCGIKWDGITKVFTHPCDCGRSILLEGITTTNGPDSPAWIVPRPADTTNPKSRADEIWDGKHEAGPLAGAMYKHAKTLESRLAECEKVREAQAKSFYLLGWKQGRYNNEPDFEKAVQQYAIMHPQATPTKDQP